MAEQHDESETAPGLDKTEPETHEPAQDEAESPLADAASESERASSSDSSEEVPAPALKKKKKKRALAEAAAAEPSRDRNRRLREEVTGGRRTKPGARGIPARNLEAGEIVDDALARSTQAAGEWLKKNFNVVQWFIIVGIVGWIGYAIYSYRAGRAAELASAQLTTAVRAENARIGAEDTKPDPQTGIVETRPAYASDAARLAAAEKQYRAVAEGGSTAAASFARLGLASVLYDQSKFADAKAAYQAVKGSKLANQDLAVKGRAIEGLGMSLEALGEKDAAQKAFGELANLDGLGLAPLGAYHQARLAFAAGNVDKAKELLKDAQKRLDSAATPDSKKTVGSAGYLHQAVRDLLRRVDPSAVTPNPTGLTAEQIQELQEQMGSPAGTDGKGMSKEKLNELLKRLSKSPGGPPPSSPAPPASAP